MDIPGNYKPMDLAQRREIATRAFARVCGPIPAAAKLTAELVSGSLSGSYVAHWSMGDALGAVNVADVSLTADSVVHDTVDAELPAAPEPGAYR